jgi:anion-transporting  ArsA/GET3 family ATPase
MPGALESILGRRVVFVTGKGGTGKSTIAAALALIAHERGKRTLLLDVDARGDAARFLGAGASTYRARRSQAGPWHLAFDAEEALDEYLKEAMHVPRLYRVGPVGKVFDFIATAAPGVAEVLIAGKVGFECRAREDGGPRWDIIVVDAAPAGQVLSHIRGPRTIMEMVRVGMIRNQTEWVREIVEDPDRSGILIVALAEEMPVSETEELVRRTPGQVDTPVIGIVANRLVHPPEHAEELEAMGREDIAPAVEAVRFLATLASNQAPHLQRLRSLGPPVTDVPELPLGRHTLEATRKVAAAL